MFEPLHSYMKVGIVHFMAFPQCLKGEGPILETITKIAEDAFFSAIEVTWIKDEMVKTKVRDLLQASHLVVGFGGQPVELVEKLDVNSENSEEREKALALLKRHIDEAYFLGAKRFALLSGPDPGEEKRTRATELLLDSLKQLCAYAQSKGDLEIVLENFDRTIDKKALIGPTKEAVAVTKAVRKEYKNFGLMVDLSHLPMLAEKPRQALVAAKAYLSHVHIGNCAIRDKSHPAYGDLHPRFGIEGGENDINELRDFLKALLAIGYLKKARARELPVVAFEVRPLGDEPSEVVIANAKRTLLEAWARV